MQVLAQVGSRATCGVPDGITLPVVLVALVLGSILGGIQVSLRGRRGREGGTGGSRGGAATSAP